MYESEELVSRPVGFLVGLFVLAGIGGGMIGQWWGHPLPSVTMMSNVIGGFLIFLSLWGMLLAARME